MQSSSSDNFARICSIKILNRFDPELDLISTKLEIENKLKDLLGELTKFEVQTILVLENKKIDDHKSACKFFHSRAKLIDDDSVIDKAFGSMHQSVMTKI